MPLPMDPAVESATLPSGAVCWARRHAYPPGSVALCLRVAVGSLCEAEDERGFAHLLEHLAFRGTAHFPPGALEAFFASLGTHLGRDHTAQTGLDQTTFTLVLPGASAPVVSRAMTCLADFAFRRRFSQEDLDSERRVVLEEMRSRSGFRARLRRDVLAALWPGSRAADRHPLGTEESLRAASLDRLEAFFRREFRPGRAAIVVVGDIDPKGVLESAALHFAGWPAGTGAPSSWSDPEPPEGALSLVVADSELREAEVGANWLVADEPCRDVAGLRAQVVESLGVWVLNRRLATAIQSGEAPLRFARAGVASLASGRAIASVTGAGEAGQAVSVARSLGGLIADQAGSVHAGEVELGARAALTEARQAVVAEPARDCRSVLADLVRSLPGGRTPCSREQRLEILKPLVGEITSEEVRATFAERFDVGRGLVVVALPDPLPPGDGAEVVGAFAPTSSAPVATRWAPARLERLAALPTSPGAVAARSDDPTGVRSAWLVNGVRVHVREMDERRGRVYVTATLAGGRIRETAPTWGLTSAAVQALAVPAARSVRSVEIRDFLAGKAVEFHAAADEDCLRLTLACDPDDVEVGFQLIRLLLAQPLLEVETLRRWREAQLSRWDETAASVELRVAERSLCLLSGGDLRFRFLDPDHVKGIDPVRAQTWLEELTGAGPLEVAVAGDLPASSTEDLALRYLGSLPARPRSDPRIDGLRELAVGIGPFDESIEVPGAPDRAVVTVGWRAEPWRDAARRMATQAAERILSSRLLREIRERRGLTYTPECSFSPSRAYPAASVLTVACYTATDRAGEAADAVRETARGLAEQGPTEEETAAARRQLSTVVERARRDPRYWSRALSELDFRGLSIAAMEAVPALVEALDETSIRDVLGTIASETRRMTVIGVPA
ncbi:MAG: M16 family metallopeptidase [Acidobacteriota bacterium]